MFHLRHIAPALLALAAALAMPAVPVAAATPALVDAIAPGVLDGVEGFGTATVLVPKGGYVTYLARTDSHLKGKRAQIWTRLPLRWESVRAR